ncbi:AAA family ATPase, partial [Paenibacillus polymyxa]
AFLPDLMKSLYSSLADKDGIEEYIKFAVIRERSFLKISLEMFHGDAKKRTSLVKFPDEKLDLIFRDIIHLPGLRGNPERTYPTTLIDSSFGDDKLPGTFEKYVASIVTHWQNNSASKLRKVEENLSKIGLTSKVKTEIINDTQVSISVGKSLSLDNNEYISIADVGLGVSQTLPVVVALIYAQPGQMVYIEQPEIHLHPKAQYTLANLLVEAANRGVKVVVETHSSLLIRGIQTLVAEGVISNQLVKLHWFTRNELSSETEINSSDLDETGGFGDWPEDFDDVTMMAEIRYLDAAEKREFERNA